MGVEVIVRRLYCNTSDTGFGPTFHSDEEAERFLCWHRERYGDPRAVIDLDQRAREFEVEMEHEVMNARCDRRAAIEHTKSKQ